MELVVVLAIVGLMGIGTSTLVSNMIKLNQKQVIKKDLINIQAYLKQQIQNDVAWGNTISNNGLPMTCLLTDDAVECNENDFLPSVDNIDIYDRAGNRVYQASSPTVGYTVTGENCNAFNGVAGNDDCPFRYDLAIKIECPGVEPSCLKPQVTVEGTFVARPSSDTSPANRINPRDYDFKILREVKVLYEPLEVVFNSTTGTGSGTRCPPGGAAAMRVRPLNRLNMDVGNNVLATPWPRFQLAAGRYDCEVYAQGYQAIGGFNIFLEVVGGVRYTIGSGFSNFGEVTNVIGNVKIELANDSFLRVLHECLATTEPTSRTTFDLGIPTPVDYSGGVLQYSDANGIGSTLTKVTCIRNK